MVLLLLAVLVGLVPIRMPGSSLLTSPITPVIIAAAGLFGATAAVLVDASCTLVEGLPQLWPDRRNLLIRLSQGLAATVIPTGLSTLLYVALHHAFFPSGGLGHRETPQFVAWAALSACALLSSFSNAALNMWVEGLSYGQRWDVLWHQNVRWMLPSFVLMSPVGFLMGVLYHQHPLAGIGFILVPVYAARLAVVYHERTLAAYKQGVELLGRVMQEAHPYTHGHLHRVARWAKRIAEEMRLPAESMQFIEDAAILHDIGKVAVDDRVLNKVGKLSEDDWAMIRKHPVVGADLVARMSYMDKVAYWIRHHHERPDGTGYPDRMRGEDIPIESSIISVVDAFDAMVGGPAKEDQRPYRKPLSQEDAMAELRRHAGTQFQARVVEVFLLILATEAKTETDEERVSQTQPEDDSLWVAPPATVGVFAISSAGGRPG